MKLRLLGTGGADGIPGMFSEDRVSTYAREHGGKDVRTRASAIIDDLIKIDFGPDTFHQVIQNSLRPSDWLAVVFTHSHEDHFAPQELQYGLFPFVGAEEYPFGIYGNQQIIQGISSRYPDWPVELHPTHSFQPYEIGDYQICPVAARHDPGEDCQNLIFQSHGASLLYATDTGWWDDPTWEWLEDVRLDAMVIECTNGLVDDSYEGHLNVESCRRVVEKLRNQGTLLPHAKILTTHHSHNGDAVHQELERALADFGAEPGYDGMELEIESARAVRHQGAAS